AFHPAAALIKRRIRAAREQACDEVAAAVLGAKEYARALVALGRSVESGAPAAWAIGMFDDHSFEEPVRRLLRSRSSMGVVPRAGVSAAAGLVLALGAGVAAAATVAVAAERPEARAVDPAVAAVTRHADTEPQAGDYAYAAGGKRDPFRDLRAQPERPL